MYINYLLSPVTDVLWFCPWLMCCRQAEDDRSNYPFLMCVVHGEHLFIYLLKSSSSFREALCCSELYTYITSSYWISLRDFNFSYYSECVCWFLLLYRAPFWVASCLHSKSLGYVFLEIKRQEQSLERSPDLVWTQLCYFPLFSCTHQMSMGTSSGSALGNTIIHLSTIVFIASPLGKSV